MTSNAGSSKLDRLSFVVLQAVLFFTPIFFVPSASVPLQTGRSAILLYGIALALVFWLIARLKDGHFALPRTALYIGAGIFGLVYSISALVSANPAASLAGQGFELGSLAFFLPSLVLFALIPLVTRTGKQVFYSYTTLFASFLALGLFHIIRFAFGPGALSFGLFADITSSPIGVWNNVAIFFGVGAILSLVTLERATLGRFFKALVYVVFILSLAMLVVVDFSPAWIVLAVLSLVFFIYELSYGKRSDGSAQSPHLGARVPYHALIVLVIAVIFAFWGGRISALVSNALGTGQVEVRPNWSATLDVSRAAIADNPVFGAGPNRFAAEWLSHKPAGINDTIFWNTDFNYGVGFIPSLPATTGILGSLAALLFVGLFVWTALRALLREGTSPFSRYLVLSSLFASVYLWTFAVIYVPSSALWILTLALSSLFVASLREDKALESLALSVIGRPRASFIAVLLSVLALIGAVSFGYFVTIQLFAAVSYQRGIATVNSSGDLDQGEQHVVDAISLSPRDTYYQTLSELYLVRLNRLAADANAGKVTQSEAQTRFQSLLATAIQAAQQAVALDPTNYQNQLALGRVFEAVVPLKIQGAYDNAKKAYQAALALNPQSPEIYLIMARLEVANKDTVAAKDGIVKALVLKKDYADAIYLLSQIQASENDVDSAIKSVSAVATLSPSDPGIFFQLGLLYYAKKDYQDAVLALERSVSLDPQYANAKYFLGLSYYLVGQKDKSLQQFKDLSVSNPESAEVESAVANLEAGKSPVPAPSQTVKQPSLPVKQ